MKTYSTALPSVQGPPNATRLFPGCAERGLCRNYAESMDLDRLRCPSAQLNDVCINLVSTVLHCNLWNELTSNYAIFSSYIMKYVEDDTEPGTIWKNTQYLSYWERKVWILPVHQRTRHHWILCVVYVDKGEVHIFDSLACQESCRSLLKVSPSTV